MMEKTIVAKISQKVERIKRKRLIAQIEKHEQELAEKKLEYKNLKDFLSWMRTHQEWEKEKIKKVEDELRELFDSIRPSIIFNKEWNKGKPTSQVETLAGDLEILGENGGVIVDAGAGLGRNSVYLADQGFSVKAIEKDIESAWELEARARDRELYTTNLKEHQGNMEVINEDMTEALKKITSNSVAAVVDSGASHYFPIYGDVHGDFRLIEFVEQVGRVLKPGGLFTLLHFSENERANPELGEFSSLYALRTAYHCAEVQTQFSGWEVPFETCRDWKEVTWKNDLGQEHTAWTVTLRKPGGIPLTPQILDRININKVPEQLSVEQIRDQFAEGKVEKILLSIWQSVEPALVSALLDKETLSNERLYQIISNHQEIKTREDDPIVKHYIEELATYILTRKSDVPMDKTEFLETSFKILKLDTEPEVD